MTGMLVGRDRIHLITRAGRKYVEIVYEMFKMIDQSQECGLVEFESPDFTLTPEAAGAMRWDEEEAEQAEEEEVAMEIVPPTDPISPSRTLSSVSASMLPRLESSRNRVDPRPSQGALQNPLTGANATQVRPGGTVGQRNPEVRFAVPPPSLPQPIASVFRAPAPPQVTPPTSWPTMLTPELSTSLIRIEQRIGTLEAKSLQDNLMMATLKEEQDTEANRAMLDRVTVVGLSIPGLFEMRDNDKIEPMRERLQELFDYLADEGQKFEAGYVRHLNRQLRGRRTAVIEVRLGSEKQAGELRTNFIKKRDNRELNGVNIIPSVRLATRVRVEILHAIGNVIKSKDSTVTKTQCLQFIPKPILKITREDPRGHEFVRSMTFIEAIVWIKENGHEKLVDLQKAYDRAGSAFRGVLSQSFVIMN